MYFVVKKPHCTILRQRITEHQFNELAEDVVYDFAMDVGEPEVAACVFERQLLVIEPELMKQRGMEIMNMNSATDASEAELVRLAVRVAGLEAATSNPNGKAKWVVIAASSIFLCVRRATELASPPNNRIVEQTTLFEVLEQRRNWLVDGFCVLRMFRQIRVLVPGWVC